MRDVTPFLEISTLPDLLNNSNSLIDDVATNNKNGTVYYWDTFLLISFLGLGIYLWICGFKNRMEGE